MDICDFANAIPVAVRRLAKEVVGAIFVVAIPPSNSLANFTMVEDKKMRDGEEKLK